MFKKLLVANRGEIAIRVLRAAAELNIKTIAVYTYEDRYSLHRYKADEAYQVGRNDDPLKPYLDIEEIEISEFNYKSKLLEWSQKNGRNLHYAVKHHSRSRHRTLYKVAAVIDGIEYGHGEDTNKKNAEKLAAKHTFEVLNLSVEEFM